MQLGPNWDAVGVSSYGGSDNGQFSIYGGTVRRAHPRGAALRGTKRADPPRLIGRFGRFEVGREENDARGGPESGFPGRGGVWENTPRR